MGGGVTKKPQNRAWQNTCVVLGFFTRIVSMWYQYILIVKVLSSSHETSWGLNVFILIEADTPCFFFSLEAIEIGL